MGSGEGDVAQYRVVVNSNKETDSFPRTIPNSWGTGTAGSSDWYSPTFTYSWPTWIFMYQIRCPKRSCKTYNWLEIEKVTPCRGCGSTLKAVLSVPDYEVPIQT